MISMAKGLTSSYLPLGAVGMRHHIAQHFQDKVFYGGLTYKQSSDGGAPRPWQRSVSTKRTASLRMQENGQFDETVTWEPGIPQSIRGRSALDWPLRHRRVGAQSSLARANGAFSTAARGNGRLGKIFPRAGPLHNFVRWNTFFNNPPLCITEKELREAFSIIDRGLDAMERLLRDRRRGLVLTAGSLLL